MKDVKILIAISDNAIANDYFLALSKLGAKVKSVGNDEDVEDIILTNKPEYIIMDMIMDKRNILDITEITDGFKPNIIGVSEVRSLALEKAVGLNPNVMILVNPSAASITRMVTKLYAVEAAGIEVNPEREDSPVPDDKDTELEVYVTNIIHELGIPAHIKGYHYVRKAILLSIEDSEMLESVTKLLYPTVAKHFATTPSRVERAIRHGIECAWDRGDVDVLNKTFGYTISVCKGKPTNSEFIALLVDNIRLRRNMN